ncbi:hypothetical protein RJ55_02988 [Drechmeria coniospora]|nr:hypothetical protein RJ55_02988 [Drechmeria coniospora]
MDTPFVVSREELHVLQMEVKQVQCSQTNHAERILRLEKRHADESALKSVWNSPFPGVLGAGTPQHDAVQSPHNEMFDDDLDEQGEQLLGSLHLGPAEEEPARRGAASRANSVRFDESALHGSSWGGQSSRHSADFGPLRPVGGITMERSLSHKSDGRHSSAGHSVHSHHSVASGRASSLGVDTNYAACDSSSPFDMPAPPASLFVLGSVPSIIRCWLTTDFAHDTLLYADICTGSQKSVVDYSLIKELGLTEEIERCGDGVYRARLNVFLAEAVVVKAHSRNGSTSGLVPFMSVVFEVTGGVSAGRQSEAKAIRIYIGSDVLRAHSADVLLSQNKMVVYGSQQERLQVPFVRPEDENVFRHIQTVHVAPGKRRLNANAAPFVLPDEGNLAGDEMAEDGTLLVQREDDESPLGPSPMESRAGSSKSAVPTSASEHGGEGEKAARDVNGSESGKEFSNGAESSRNEASAPSGIWRSWRQGTVGGSDGQSREAGPLSGYQPAIRSGRSMKVLKSLKAGSASARTGAAYEPPLAAKAADGRRKSLVSIGVDGGSTKWDAKRAVSSGAEFKMLAVGRDGGRTAAAATLPRSVNPVGVASAFSWMTPASKGAAKSSTAADGD